MARSKSKHKRTRMILQQKHKSYAKRRKAGQRKAKKR